MTSILSMIKKAYTKPKSLRWYISAPLPIIATITLIVILTIAPKLIESLVKANAIETAIELTKTLQNIRNYYAEHVLEDVDDKTGIDITHLHKLSDNSIPIPATFLLEMAESTPDSKLNVNIVSPYPFVSRKNRSMDQFQQQAWQLLIDDSSTPVSQFDTVNDRRVVKVALPDKLTSIACVSCHNSHPDSPKTDWQLNQVRGLIEITVDVELALKRANQLSVNMTLTGFASLMLIVFFNFRLARKIVNPLANITSAIGALSERKLLTHQSNHKDYLEVESLSQALVNLQNNELKRQSLEREVHQLAYYDNLTQLPNRASLVSYLHHKIAYVVADKQLNLIILNIEKFNEVYDVLGEKVANQAIVEVANRLKSAVQHDFFAHINTAEFAIIHYQHSNNSKPSLIDSCLAAIHEPIFIDQHQINLSLNAGICQIKNNTLSVSEVIAQANIALHHAEQSQTEKVVIYTEALSEQLNKRVNMIKALKIAIEQEQLVPYFQPQFDLVSGDIIGAEVLLRWIKPDGSLVSPVEFIPLAEKSRLIIPIGKLVLNKACQLNKRWQQQGLKPIRIAVNVSGVQFEQDDMVSSVKQAIHDSGLDPKWLELEVTETALMADIDDIINKLNQLRSLGLELAIDDFGTGYSSLSYLKQLPIDRLKVDQSFVRNITTNEDDQAIVNMILALGQSMNLKIIAEGIEGKAEEQLLTTLGCDEGQGYYYAKPMPAEEFEHYLRRFS